MRIPATAMTQNLMFTRSGTWWATWRLSPLPYGYSPVKEKQRVKAHHQALFQALRGEAVLLGLTADLDPASVVEQMISGVELDSAPAWVEEVGATLDLLESIPLGMRAFWLSVPLTSSSPMGFAKDSIAAATTDLRDRLTLPRLLPSARTIGAVAARAAEVERAIPTVFQPVPASAAEQVWIMLHSQQRGLGADRTVPSSTANGDLTEEIIHTGSALPAPWLDEGGTSDHKRTSTEGLNPFKRRYLKVGSATESESYQVVQAITGVPHGGVVFPGVEWLSFLDRLPLDADWGLRLTIVSAEQAKNRNRKAETSLKEQYKQREGDDDITGSSAELDPIAANLQAYQQALNSSDREVEVQATTIIAVGGETAGDARAKGKMVAAAYKDLDFILEPPLGGQEDLWWQMLPGVPTSRLSRELAQVTTGREFAASVPMISTMLGASKGSLLALNISSARLTPVLLDPEGSMVGNVSGSLGASGELGSGKSFLLEKAIGDSVDRGGRFVGIDRSDNMEWGVFAATITDSTVVEIVNPEYSLDPLRVFGVDAGAEIAQSLFATLLNIAPTSEQGVVISEVLDHDYLRRNELHSLSDVRKHLESNTGLVGAPAIAKIMNVFARKKIGRVIFDDSLPALPLDSRAIVFCTRGLELPSRDELMTEHLFRQMGLEKVFGRSIYALLAGVAYRICFSEDSELAIFGVDEAHHVTGSPEGESYVFQFIRYGRKHKAAVYLGSHDAESDFGSEVLRNLIPIRILLRHTSESLAKRGLRWLGLDEDDASLVEEVTKDLSPLGDNDKVIPGREGEALMRDARGRFGKIKVLPPANPARDEAVRSTPPVDREASLVGV
ncbi:type IV secretion system protein VirB4 [Rathayibacter rathayi]|uniref:ATP-binding protein n=1 Tax=Rathayibacter rathayi TaxID=33887 RepID=UPI000CE83F2C|nr:ATP-binding protein [Rathayibacter rathayi]PPG77484.1 type IV secretion system protein VirB4 [Rathayibacter rathayi]PPG94320.1 type IV secretion system protein VirB4 [Rathayibacter rathayi]PPI65252.1 type IV secretion system protein VirB4 [Rathayibacter rathayi]